MFKKIVNIVTTLLQTVQMHAVERALGNLTEDKIRKIIRTFYFTA
jgi:hypothetical protein